MAAEQRAAVEYGWTKAAHKGGDAQKVGERLARIARRRGGLTAEQVIEVAESERSNLHGYFEWDDEVAAYSHRLNQARELIRAVVIVRDAEAKPPIRAFWLVTHAEDRAYVPVYAVLSDGALRLQVLQRALRELDEWRRRYDNLVELADVIAIIDRTVGDNRKEDGENGAED